MGSGTLITLSLPSCFAWNARRANSKANISQAFARVFVALLETVCVQFNQREVVMADRRHVHQKRTHHFIAYC